MAYRGYLNDKKLQKLTKKLGKELTDRVVKVGILQSAGAGESHESHPAQRPGPGSEISMVELAAIHEFGSPAAGIKARSFIGATFKQKGIMAEKAVLSRKIASGILNKKIDIEQGLEILGAWGAARVKKRIEQGIRPKNRPATIAKKGSSKPLVDTGRLINAVTYKVDK